MFNPFVLAEIAGSNLEYANTTTMHPLALLVVVCCGVALLVVPRRWALLPCMVMASTVTPTQRIVVASVDFSLLRIIVLFALVRLLMKGESRGLKWTKLDTLMILWAACGSIVYTLQWGDFSAFVNRAGVSFEALGLYFLFRSTIRSWDELASLSRVVAFAAVPIACFFALEHFTQRNIFSIFGGVPEVTLVRDGKIRCQGAYSHPIIAGVFWASVMPLAAMGWWIKKSWRPMAVVGASCCFMIAYFTASSTSLAAVGAAFFGAALWPFRKNMFRLQMLVLFGLVCLHFVMRAPVWHLIARVDIVGGSTGYHRYKLIDNAIRHFDEWAVLGVRSTLHWGYGMQDITVNYVLQGVRGGFLTLVIFVGVILTAFAAIGKARRLTVQGGPREKIVWAIGVSMGVHVASFFGVSYFGQATMVWNLSLALSMSVLAAALADRKLLARMQAAQMAQHAELYAAQQQSEPDPPPHAGPRPAPGY